MALLTVVRSFIVQVADFVLLGSIYSVDMADLTLVTLGDPTHWFYLCCVVQGNQGKCNQSRAFCDQNFASVNGP